MTDNRIIGEFFSATAPSESEKMRLAEHFEKKLNRPVRIEWIKDESVKKGFVLKILNEVYDNTPSGLLRGLKTAVDEVDKTDDDYISLVRESVEKGSRALSRRKSEKSARSRTEWQRSRD